MFAPHTSLRGRIEEFTYASRFCEIWIDQKIGASRRRAIIPPPTRFYGESKDLSSQSIIVFAHNIFIEPLDDCRHAKTTIASTKRPTQKSSPSLHSLGRFCLAYATYGILRYKKKAGTKSIPAKSFPFSLKPISISVTRIGLRPICLQKDRLHINVLVLLALVGNSDFGFRFLGRPESGIPIPSSEFRNFPAETQIGKPENRSSRKSEFRFRFFRNSGIPLITYIGTQYIPILYYNLRK